jgi:hypothetical protein
VCDSPFAPSVGGGSSFVMKLDVPTFIMHFASPPSKRR